MATKLSLEEKAIIDYVESGTAASIDQLESEKQRYRQIARDQITKTQTVNIQLLESDLESLKAQSISKGLSYQALISSLVHQYASGKIKLDI